MILASFCKWLGCSCCIPIRNLQYKALALLPTLVCFMDWYFLDDDLPGTSLATDLRDVWVSLNFHIWLEWLTTGFGLIGCCPTYLSIVTYVNHRLAALRLMPAFLHWRIKSHSSQKLLCCPNIVPKLVVLLWQAFIYFLKFYASVDLIRKQWFCCNIIQFLQLPPQFDIFICWILLWINKLLYELIFLPQLA